MLDVLVFDDDLVHRTGFLAQVDARFVYRAHADQAVAVVRQLRPDVVLMDYSMGAHLTGAEAVADLRGHFDAHTLPIIGISSEMRCNHAMILAGANDAVAKAVLPHRLPQLLEGLASAGQGEA